MATTEEMTDAEKEEMKRDHRKIANTFAAGFRFHNLNMIKKAQRMQKDRRKKSYWVREHGESQV